MKNIKVGLLSVLLLLSACVKKEDEMQSKIEKSEEILAQATVMLEEAKLIQNKNASEQKVEEAEKSALKNTDESKATEEIVEKLPLKNTDKNKVTASKDEKVAEKTKDQNLKYEDWVQACVKIRQTGEQKCTSLASGAEQSACLLAASRDMALCMAGTGAENLQGDLASKGEELGTLLGSTAKELTTWVEKNESSFDNIAKAAAPFFKYLGQENQSQLNADGSNKTNQAVEDLFKNFGDAFNKALGGGS